ncbi:hypothetical protein NMG60_11000801 [Bertholletia excelsa]
MKRKDDEKIMGPMFPRLHVNDTDKGGPRAPPRNKMALYEQLSIPSQRFNPRMTTFNSNNSAGVVPPASSRQGGGRERGGMFFPHHIPHSIHPTEQSHGYCDFSTPLAQLEQKKKLEEEDFAVPIFVQSELMQDHRHHSCGIDGENISPPSPALNQSVGAQNSIDKEPNRSIIGASNLRQEGRSQNKETLHQMGRSVKNSSVRGKSESSRRQIDSSSGQERANNFDKLRSTSNLHHQSRVSPQLHSTMCGNDISNESGRGIENETPPLPRRDFYPEEVGTFANPINNDEYPDDKMQGSPQTENGDRADDASETSMVDSISGLDISPDDVVGIIGQKQFWKARRAIANQQRVFAVQVFELHRLIKVQRLIAGSPHLLLEDGYLDRPLKASSTKRLPLEYIVKPSAHIVKHKDDSENPNHKMECSAENAVGKSSHSSVQNVSQPSNYYRPSSGNPQSAAPIISENKMNPCYFHQPPGHQWLVPVMSPSEGLIYKPYPAHGCMAPFCGGCGPPGSNPMMGNFINPAYGVGVPPASPPMGPGFFAPYGMPVINPVISGSAGPQANNNFQGMILQEQNGNLHHQSLSNLPTQKHEAVPNIAKPRASKESELQGSTASSPGERAPRIGVARTMEENNALPLFPTSPAVHVIDGAPQIDETDCPTRVIRVIPHNTRSATESAARIFRSIQEERRRHESV